MTATLAPPANRLFTHLARIDPKLVKTSEGRKEMCALDPMLFALIYLPHHLKNDFGKITISYVHEDWADEACEWIATSAAVRYRDGDENDGDVVTQRDSYVAPRSMGKSTWFFLILPLWAAAFGHRKFAAAFADSGVQAETHLSTFKNELDTNKLLRADFPTLCRPAKRANSGQAVADSRAMIVMQSGFTFAARGIDASNLGLKVNTERPDLIIFDDVEPHESNYSAYQAGKRLETIIEAVLPMNLRATVVFVGTVTMAGGITHQLVNSVMSKTEPAKWIHDEHIRVHYYGPITTHPDGTRESIWPEKWSLRYLDSISHTRSFAKNFKNLPVVGDGEYWKESDFVQNRSLEGIRKVTLSIDPATTTKRTSDFTGMSIIAYKPGFRPRKGSRLPPRVPKCLVISVYQVKLAGEKLRKKALDMIEKSPVAVDEIYIEVNQGGEAWLSVFHHMPIPVVIMTNSVKKELRASQLLTFYHNNHVEHYEEFPELEEQMVNYPNSLNDDLIDSVGTGVRRFAKKKRQKQMQATNKSYA